MPGARKELKLCEAKSSVDEPPEVELKELPPHLEYAFLEGDDKLPVIIAKDLKDEEKAALLKVLKSHKRAIAWKLSDIKGVSPEFCTHKILMEEDYEPSVQSQRRVNPKIHDVIKKEVEKLLDAGLIYPISDSPWVSPVHCVPRNGGYGPSSQMDEELTNSYSIGTDGEWLLGLFSDPIDPKDHGKDNIISHTELSRLLRRMPFGLCNAPGYVPKMYDGNLHDMIEKDGKCIDSFNTLKRKLTEAPILIAPDWDLPFELMCDASDFAIGAVLGQRKNKHFQPIHYASKTMNEAQTHYTTTKRKLLAVVTHAVGSIAQKILIFGRFETKKGAGESSPPIILSNLKIPPQDKLQRQRNQYEAFPLENLGSISTSDQSTPCSVLISDKTLWFFSGQEALGLSHKLARDYWGHTMDFPDCEDSRARSIHMSFTSSASFWESRRRPRISFEYDMEIWVDLQWLS
ncbi:reverse transcriptase domain-containing protein [Tanacetum coccineum]